MNVLRSPPADSGVDLADALRPVLHRLYRRLRRESEELDRGISSLQNLLLTAILDQPGIGVAALAGLEGLRGPTISAHIDRLAAAGLVLRTRGGTDRRRIALTVTAKGRSSLEAIKRRRRDWLANRIAALPARERRAIRRAIAPLLTIAGG